MASRRVKKLKECASDSIYFDLYAKINHLFSSKSGISFVNEDDFNLRRDQVVKDIREKLDEFLVGSFSQDRHQLHMRFINGYTCCPRPNFDLVFTFFSCVLDSSFTSFSQSNGTKTHPFQLMDPIRVMQVVNKHSPLVENLTLSFGIPGAHVPFIPAITDHLSSLERLTRLAISWRTEDVNTLPFFVSVGTCCPKLTILELDNLQFGTEELLALLLGPRHELIPPSLLEQMRTGDNVLADMGRLEFSQENLTPICSSLKEIKHYHNSNSPENCSSWDSCVVLTLRHLRLLEILKHECFKRKSSNAVARTVQCFHQEQQVASNRIEEDEDVLTTFAQSSSPRLGTIRWTFDSSFTGRLNLVELTDGNFNIQSRSMMQAITALCPHLKEVRFHSYHNLQDAGDSLLSLQELRSLLSSSSSNSPTSCWPKVEEISLCGLSSCERQVILSCIGGDRLIDLAFVNCMSIDPVIEVMPYTRLERLGITQNTGMNTLIATDVSDLSSRLPPEILNDFSLFLPNLRIMTTFRTCLGPWSRLFECYRPTLTTLRLACSHIGVPSKTRYNWCDIPDLWPNLEKLYFDNMAGMSIATLKEIIPRFKNLEQLFLSHEMLFPTIAEREEGRDFATQMRNRPVKSISVSYHSPPVETPCPCY